MVKQTSRILFFIAILCVSSGQRAFSQDFPAPGYDLIRDDGTNENRRGALNLTGAGVSCADDSANNETECDIAGGGGDAFGTIAVPAGASVVADSSTDTLTLTETSFLTLTGTAATDTIDITQVTTDLGTDGLIAANAVALGTDTTNAYVTDLTAGTYIDVSGGGGETANVTVTVDATEMEAVTFGAGGNASNVWTFDLSGTDPTLTAGSALLTVGGALTSTGTITGVAGTFTGLLTGSANLTVGNGVSAGTLTLLEGTGGGTNFKAFVSPAAITADTTCTFENDANFIPDSCVGDGTDAGVTATYSKSFNITGVTASGDFGAIWKTPNAITITSINVLATGGTNVVGQLDECDANGATCATVDSADITATAGTNAADDGALSNASIDANDWIGWHTTSVSGTNTRVGITFNYTVN